MIFKFNIEDLKIRSWNDGDSNEWDDNPKVRLDLSNWIGDISYSFIFVKNSRSWNDELNVVFYFTNDLKIYQRD